MIVVWRKQVEAVVTIRVRGLMDVSVRLQVCPYDVKGGSRRYSTEIIAE
ncbi:single stranded DNA-binding domain-containing protein [Clostridium felsineum]